MVEDQTIQAPVSAPKKARKPFKKSPNPTFRQKKALELLILNGGNVGKSMRQAGYSKHTAKTPQVLTESLGFQQLLNNLGLTDHFLVRALKSDIEKKPKNRKAELELAFRIKGRLAPEDPDNDTAKVVNNILNVFTVDQAELIARRILSYRKEGQN